MKHEGKDIVYIDPPLPPSKGPKGGGKKEKSEGYLKKLELEKNLADLRRPKENRYLSKL